jgi:hypothetical protein
MAQQDLEYKRDPSCGKRRSENSRRDMVDEIRARKMNSGGRGMICGFRTIQRTIRGFRW